MGALLITVLLGSFLTGYFLASIAKNYHMREVQKPVVKVNQENARIKKDTSIVFEKEYLRSNKVVISDFPDKDEIYGLTLEEVKKIYSENNGFSVWFDNQNLIVHQKVDDWAPEDKNRYRFKVYNGMVAVYKGASADDDILFKVTAVRFATLPANIQRAVTDGKYEFANEQELNDALENFDEYE